MQRKTVYLYTSQRVANTQHYRISITAELIRFLSSLNRAWVELYNKSVFFCMVYERRYRDVKSESKNLHLKKIIHVLLQFSTICGGFPASDEENC